MIKNLEEMKCVIFEEWSFDPPAAAILTAFENGLHCIWDIAEYLDVDELFLKDAMRYYGLLD